MGLPVMDVSGGDNNRPKHDAIESRMEYRAYLPHMYHHLWFLSVGNTDSPQKIKPLT